MINSSNDGCQWKWDRIKLLSGLIFLHLWDMIQNNVSSIPPNPFDVEDKEKGWKHFLENSRPISKSEAFQKMKIVNQIENRWLGLSNFSIWILIVKVPFFKVSLFWFFCSPNRTEISLFPFLYFYCYFCLCIQEIRLCSSSFWASGSSLMFFIKSEGCSFGRGQLRSSHGHNTENQKIITRLLRRRISAMAPSKGATISTMKK